MDMLRIMAGQQMLANVLRSVAAAMAVICPKEMTYRHCFTVRIVKSVFLVLFTHKPQPKLVSERASEWERKEGEE
jgi:hypothetical protein